MTEVHMLKTKRLLIFHPSVTIKLDNWEAEKQGIYLFVHFDLDTIYWFEKLKSKGAGYKIFI